MWEDFISPMTAVLPEEMPRAMSWRGRFIMSEAQRKESWVRNE